MKIPRTLAVFLCAAGALLALAILKALAVTGLHTLPPVKVLVFAVSTFGLIAALIDWALLRDLIPGTDTKSDAKTKPASPGTVERQSENAAASTPPQAPAQQNDPLIERVRIRPIVFREICPPPDTSGLSFYGGAPIGPATLAWPRVRNKPGDALLSFIMQWDSAELARQDFAGLLPRDGALYLFADLTWGDPFDFQFVHAPGPVIGWQALPIPPGLPALYGGDGAYLVPYCSPLIAKEGQKEVDVPRLLPKWPFFPIAFSYPAPPHDPDFQPGDEWAGWYWNDGESTAEALLLVEHPEGAPTATRRTGQPSKFGRPFAAFPHDYAAVRVVTSELLEQLRHPERLLRESPEIARQETFEAWKNEAAHRYSVAARHRPGARVEQSESDEIWRWMEGLAPALSPGWGSLVEKCANVSLGLESEAASSLPAGLVAVCTEHHRLASAYLHDEYPDHSKPEAFKTWEARKAEGLLIEIRSLHAPCPNHMFGPASYVQGHVEEYLREWVLLLEISTSSPIGLEFGEGVLQFLILPSDLREGRFDRVKLVASAY